MSRPTNPPHRMVCSTCRHDSPTVCARLVGGDPLEAAIAAWADADSVGAPPCPGWAEATNDDPATLRARLQERYERPERPCTYDPADEEPEAEPVADREVIIPARSEYTPGPWPATYIVRFEGDTYSCADCPTCKAPIFVLAGTGIPTTGELDARSGVIARNTDWTPHTCPTVEPKPLTDDYRDGDVEDTGPAIGRPGLPYRILHAELKSLRSYLRTLTNPDAPAEDVAAALALLTDEDRELVAALTKRNP